MTIQDLGAVGDFIGGAAVLVTLIYLAMQIKQNTKVHASLIRQNFYDSTQRMMLHAVESTARTRGGHDCLEFAHYSPKKFFTWNQRYSHSDTNLKFSRFEVCSPPSIITAYPKGCWHFQFSLS